MATNRIDVFDNMRGISILSVIAIHCAGGLGASDFMGINAQFGLALRQIINYSVPVFLFISGYLSFNGKHFSFLSLSKRLKRIAYPFLFWSFIYICFKSFISKKTPPIESVLVDIITGNSIVIGYFVIVLLQYTFISNIIASIKSRKTNIIVMIILSISGITYTYSTQIYYSHSLASQFPYYALPFIIWYPFYHLGIYCNKYKIRPQLKLWIGAFISFLIFSIMEGYYLYGEFNYSFAVSQVKITSVLLSISVCMIISSLIDMKVKESVISKIGSMSYGLYLTHVLFMIFITKILGFFFNEQSSIIFFLVLYALTSITSIIFVFFVNKILPSSIKKYIIG